ncbi:MAG TPA: hypothetical protein VK206_19145 [Anaerolineales bacterium]|nr:hypothetical protein [Anaerolineales bacterium]
MFNKLVSIATGRNVLRSLIATLVFIVVMNIGATAFFRFTHGVGILDTGGGANLLDNRTGGYSPESAYQMISAYGSQGIRYHLMLSLADAFFPPTLALSLFVTIVYFYTPFFQSQPLTRWLTALPIVYLFSDYMENIGIVTMLLSFPFSVPGMARLANFMFMVKNLSSTAAIVANLIGLVLLGVRLVRKRPPRSAFES